MTYFQNCEKISKSSRNKSIYRKERTCVSFCQHFLKNVPWYRDTTFPAPLVMLESFLWKSFSRSVLNIWYTNFFFDSVKAASLQLRFHLQKKGNIVGVWPRSGSYVATAKLMHFERFVSGWVIVMDYLTVCAPQFSSFALNVLSQTPQNIASLALTESGPRETSSRTTILWCQRALLVCSWLRIWPDSPFFHHGVPRHFNWKEGCFVSAQELPSLTQHF